MYLKSIELCGFKSFADKTILDFDKQLTVIVGPNGCGKSNIVDAVRWCLGEQSAYSLRTPQMSGVVFNGSQTRPPLNLSEVTIIFDNSSNILPISYTEVEIKRKLFRSGESEYYINKTQCRLKDIHNLFLDTGIGREGYSIFEQGKVEFITNAKPEERRALFEEAAGVAKYKVRREETLRKLERVHNDMNRVNDIMSVIKEQINSLESDVKRAKLYQKYTEELRTFEIANITKKINQLHTDLTPVYSSIEKLKDELVQKNTFYNTLNAEFANIQFEKTKYETELTEVYTKLAQINSEIAHSEERIQSSQERIKEFENRQKTLKANITDFDSTKKSMEESISKISAELKGLQKNVDEVQNKYNIKKKELLSLQDEISQCQQKQTKSNNRIFEYLDERTKKNSELAKHNSDLTSISNKIFLCNKELSKINNEKTGILQELSKSETELKNLNEEYNTCENDHKQLTDKRNNSEKNLQILKTEYTELKEKYFCITSKIKTLNELQSKDPKLVAAYNVLSRKFNGIPGTVNDILNISELHKNLVVNLLGEKLHFIVCDKLQDAQDAISYLKKENLGWASFIVLELIPDIPQRKFVGQFRGEKSISSVVRCDKKYEKLAQFLFANTYFSGNDVFQEGILHGGSSPKYSQIPDVELKSLESTSLEINQQIEIKEQKLKQFEEEIEKVIQEQTQKYNQLQQLKFSIESLKKEIQNKTQQIELINIEYKTVLEEIEKHKSDEQKIKTSLANLQKEIINTETDIKESQSQKTQLDENLINLRNKEKELSSHLTDIAGDSSTYNERLSSYKREYETLNTHLTLQQNQFVLAIEEIKTLTEKITEQENIYKYETDNIDKLYETKSDYDKKISDFKAQHNKIYKTSEQKQNKIIHLQTELNTVQQKIHEYQLIQKGKEIEKNNLTKQLQDMGIEYSDAVDSYLQLEVDEEKIARLKRKIDGMGPVNIAAQEQYADLEKRHNFLLEQQQDLIKAEEDLRQAIYKINSSIRESFQETFQQVRENFKNVFKQLFEGGEADIFLTDENNLLESGVEIIAQPPGKKLQSGTLLSGGEKALTAIGLLFAFFLVKPSPVCVLDEVDAPLDDANVVRFINLIKTYVEKSQFLIITHNKRTIEQADVIYGVTMEEYGISKIISLVLRKQEQTIPSEKIGELVTA